LVPDRTRFSKQELKLIDGLRTPNAVQKYLSALPYNWEREGPCLRSFRQVVARSTAHCLEAALFAAVVLEQHGHPPLLVSLESEDKLDHVLFIYQRAGLWGSIGRSRDLGLHGRKPVFRTVRQLVWSYFDPYVDLTGRLIGYGRLDLYELGRYDWRFSPRNLWKVEDRLRDIPHARLRSSNKRWSTLVNRFKQFKQLHPDRSPDYFEGKQFWVR
jgi:hypothetical protein